MQARNRCRQNKAPKADEARKRCRQKKASATDALTLGDCLCSLLTVLGTMLVVTLFVMLVAEQDFFVSTFKFIVPRPESSVSLPCKDDSYLGHNCMASKRLEHNAFGMLLFCSIWGIYSFHQGVRTMLTCKKGANKYAKRAEKRRRQKKATQTAEAAEAAEAEEVSSKACVTTSAIKCMNHSRGNKKKAVQCNIGGGSTNVHILHQKNHFQFKDLNGKFWKSGNNGCCLLHSIMQSLAVQNPDFLQKIIDELPCDPIESLGKPSKDDAYLRKFAAGVKELQLIERQHVPFLDTLIGEKKWQTNIVAEAVVWHGMFQQAGLNLVWSEVSEINGSHTEEVHNSQPIADETDRQNDIKV